MSRSIPGGSFNIARKIFESPIWIKPPLYLKVFLFLIGKANHSDIEKNGMLYKRGELVTTYDKIIKGVTYVQNRKWIFPTLKQVRRILDWLESEGMVLANPIQVERPTGADPTASSRAYIGIRIVIINYDTYQTQISYKGRHKGRRTAELGHNNNNEEECFNNIYAQNALSILSYLNEKTQRHYRDASNIEARLKDGGTVEECKRIIDNKLLDPYFKENPKYLNPETLFRKKHWDKYLNESIPANKPKPSRSNSELISCPRCKEKVHPNDLLTGGGCFLCESQSNQVEATA